METMKKGVQDSLRYIPLLQELVKRDFKMKYKRTYLGMLWSMLDPLLHMLVITIVFSQLLGRDIQYFAVYVMTGRLALTFFVQAANGGVSSFVGGGLYIKSVKMPLYMLPLSKAVSALINEALSLLALAFIIWITGAGFKWTILLLPVPIFYIFLFSFGMGMALATWMVFFRDTSHLFGVVTTLLQFLTPVFYSADSVPVNFQWIFQINPLYHFVTMMRKLVMYGTLPTLIDHLICVSCCAAALLVGAAVYRNGRNKFILHL